MLSNIVINAIFLGILSSSKVYGLPCSGESSLSCDGCRTLHICLPFLEQSISAQCVPSEYCRYKPELKSAICDPEPTPECVVVTESTPATPSSTTATTSQLEPVPSLRCTGYGLYPDPYDCNAYHFCYAEGVQSEARRCPMGQGFHYPSAKSSDQPCRALASPADECLKVTCSGRSVFDFYDPEAQFYAHCHTDMRTGTRMIAMYRCTDGAVFNGHSCRLRCETEGLIANTVQPSTYYQCYQYGGQLTLRLLYCPPNKVFDAKENKCV